MDPGLANSYRECLAVARRSGSNFYYSFFTLPRHLFRDTCVLYAFMRRTDDLGDDPRLPLEDRRRRLADWRAALEAALRGGPCAGVFPALVDVAGRHAIPGEYLTEVVAGVEGDLEVRSIETWAELQQYCYQVAGVVGLCCIRVWGYSGEQAASRAIQCGLAFQLTNILRDLAEDAAVGRVYLPREDLDRFACTVDDLKSGVCTAPVQNLIEFELQRAREHYGEARGLLNNLAPPGRRILSAMLNIYGGLLDEIERRDGDVFSRRVALPAWRKWSVVARSFWPISRSASQSGPGERG